ncbi:SOS response-associated peptidase family protein [Asticcacaulis sp. BYS171W]|uniref:Abasic site processing protein n=1 Tax=Asticcacaulis aquaticus TaxID=2984212 RepID=A0ABT5HWP8_9CAUL|nr:SOS response-associated peptidase family protein [Asticcacaulis aquaticus]MDC7684512.1 SOS response-associated peptidase family protein [Asticcacaulis aquaticus]
MCGRYKGPDTWAELHQVLGSFTHQPDIFDAAPYEIRPTNKVPICIRNHQGQFEWVKARWSLIPHWHHGAIKDWKATSFNAKVEEAPTKPSWRDPWKKRHCIIPASCFWEWSGC